MRFETTTWSTVINAGKEDGPARRDALEALCLKYWPPLYLFVRRRGHTVEDAQDLVQGFFSFLLEKNHIEKADSERGRFRTFLLHTLRGYMSNERRKQKTQKRGDGVLFIPLQELHRIEGTNQLATTDSDGPNTFDRAWAHSTLEEAIADLKARYVSKNQGDLFEELRSTLSGDGESVSYESIGQRLKKSPGAVRVAAHRLRRQFSEALRQQVTETLANPTVAEVDQELRHLLNSLYPGIPFDGIQLGERTDDG
jgi:RNA polymerase sigma-70 factor (ECF subfamily)